MSSILCNVHIRKIRYGETITIPLRIITSIPIGYIIPKNESQKPYGYLPVKKLTTPKFT